MPRANTLFDQMWLWIETSSTPLPQTCTTRMGGRIARLVQACDNPKDRIPLRRGRADVR